MSKAGVSGGRVLLVADEHSRGALAAARALGAAGWDVGVATPAARGLLPASRHIRRRHPVAPPGSDLRSLARSLAPVVEQHGYELVLGGGDDWVLALAAGADLLPCAVPHQPYAAVRRAFDKSELAKTAQAVGLAPPRTLALGPTTLNDWDGPLVVKQRLHVVPGQGGSARIETRVFNGPRSARSWCAQLLDEGRPAILQEVVPGGLVALTVLVDASYVPVAAVQQEALRVWPQPAGVSSFAITTAVDADLLNRVVALLAALGLTGLAQVQLLRDAFGALRCIDLNPRTYGSLALAISAGVDLPVLWAAQALGRAHRRALLLGRPGASYQWLEGDLRSAIVSHGLARGVFAATRAAPGAVHATFARDDLRPAAVHAGLLLGRGVTKVAGFASTRG